MRRLSLFEAAREAPEKLALLTRDGAFTYRSLAERVERAAAWLSEQGVKPGDARPIALQAASDLTTVELFWALASLGRPVLMLNARSSVTVRQSLVDRTRAIEVDVHAWERARPTFGRRYAEPREWPIERDFVLIATSGTTGRPKLAVLSERALLASAAAHYANAGIEDDDRWLLCLSPAHVGGLSILTRAAYSRTAVVTFEGETPLRSRVSELGEALAATRTRVVSLVPTLLDDLLDAGFTPPPSLRAVLLGGAATSQRLLEKAFHRKVPVLPSYGLTEGASQIAARPYVERWAPPDPSSSLPSSGRPLAGVTLRLGDDGRLEFSGPSLFSRYWDDSASISADGYFRTSDRALFNERGELVILGRADDVIVTGGEKVDPLAVEAVLLAFPGVRAACVFGEPDPSWGQVVAAAVVATSPLDEAALREHCAARLATFERPRLIASLEALTETPGGKLDRNETRRSAAPFLHPLAGVKHHAGG